MSTESSRLPLEQTVVRLSRDLPYLRIGNATVFVSDQDNSLQFYLDKLGFSLVIDHLTSEGERWVAVAPPDGSATLVLTKPKAGSDEMALIGRSNWVTFVSEDVEALYARWLANGVPFLHPPQPSEAGGSFAAFADVDGNTLLIAGFDRVTRELEIQRRMALEKLEVERRSARELEIARNVQMRLFPQRRPAIATLDYVGLCLQARAVGGDYYDFLSIDDHRLGLVIGDVAGKGIGAALLMVNLQANIRSHGEQSLHDPLHVLKSVNERFYANTHDSAYATLFFAEYDGVHRRLTYVNCGHLSGILIRDNGGLELLRPTSTVLGLFPSWSGEVAQTDLLAGDTVVLYTDGVTEAANSDEEEFGEARLVAAIQKYRSHRPDQMIQLIAEDVKQFSVGEQMDDITFIAAKGRFQPGV